MCFVRQLRFVLISSALVAFFFSSCTVVKNAPKGVPFVSDNIINIKGNLPKDEKKRLANDLETYWDDSLYAQKIQQFGFRYVIKNPPAFDTANISRTTTYMRGYLNSQGYYNARFVNLDSTGYSKAYKIDTIKGKLYTTVTLDIDPGKGIIIDSMKYNIHDTRLDRVSADKKNPQVIVPGKTSFTKQNIAAELDRIVALARNRGYFLMSRDKLLAEVDTADVELLSTTSDPFELAQIIAHTEEKKLQNPTCRVSIQRREQPDSVGNYSDSAAFKRYYIGDIYYFPETGRYDIPDSLLEHRDAFKRREVNSYTTYYKEDLFRYKVLREHTFQRKGNFYNEENFYKTLNNFNQIGAWERIDYRTTIRKDTVDFYYFLTPRAKQSLTFYLELSRNTGDLLATGTLVGLALNTTYTNRNVWHRAIQSSTTFSNGVEFSIADKKPLLQTFQTSLTHSYAFPRFILPWKIKTPYRLDDVRTRLNLSGTYIERKDYYRLRSFVTNWGYEWRVRNHTWSVKIPNIELYSLDTLPQLNTAFEANPFLRTSFNTGSVVGEQISLLWVLPSSRSNISNILRLGGEESGLVLGRFRALRDNIYQYFKFEADYRKLITYRKQALAFRVFGGAGYNYGKSTRFGNTLPFFKQFVGGGPNSMRAWGLRLIGLGSSLASDTASSFRDRYGDMQLEANAEFRFTLAEFSAVRVGSAFFTDIGNVWNLHENPADPSSKFGFSNLPRDIAIGVGTGLRFDFSYFMIRVDMGIKLKDPARPDNNGWMNISDFTWKNYSYTRKNPDGSYAVAPRNNYAVQLGIGLPF